MGEVFSFLARFFLFSAQYAARDMDVADTSVMSPRAHIKGRGYHVPVHETQPWRGDSNKVGTRVILKHLEWTTVYDSKELARYRVAYLLTERVPDLVRGEGLEDGMLLEKVMKSYADPNSTFNLHLRYYCVHGPENFTQTQQDPDEYVQSLESKPPNGPGSRPGSKRQRGNSWKLGCMFGFEVRSFKFRPGVVEVRQSVHGPGHSQQHHCRLCSQRRSEVLGVGLSGWARDLLRQWFVCEPELKLQRAVERLKARVLSRVALEHGLNSPGEAEQRMYEKKLPYPADYMATCKAVENIKVKYAKLEWERHPNVQKSIAIYVQEYKQIIFCQGQALGNKMSDGSVTEMQPFVLVIVSDEQATLLQRRGVGNTVLIDSTFGTNTNHFSKFTLMVVNEHGRGRPVAWFITSNEQADTIALALSQVSAKAPRWKPVTFISDCCDAETKAVRQVFPNVRVHLCIWHVKRAWLKNMRAHIRGDDKEALKLRVDIMDDLNTLVAWKPRPDIPDKDAHSAAGEKFAAFLEKWEKRKDNGCDAFVKYFRTEWSTKKEQVMKAFRVRSGKGIHTNNALEGYHSAIKSRFFNRRSTRGARLDWMLFMLLELVMPHYRKMQALEDAGLVKNKRLAEQTKNAMLVACRIKESDVEVVDDGSESDHGGRFKIKVKLPSEERKHREEDAEDDEPFVATVTGVSDAQIDLRVFSDELECDCYVGLEGGFMCPCKVVAATRFRPGAKNLWLGNSTTPRTVPEDGLTGDDDDDVGFENMGVRDDGSVEDVDQSGNDRDGDGTGCERRSVPLPRLVAQLKSGLDKAIDANLKNETRSDEDKSILVRQWLENVKVWEVRASAGATTPLDPDGPRYVFAPDASLGESVRRKQDFLERSNARKPRKTAARTVGDPSGPAPIECPSGEPKAVAFFDKFNLDSRKSAKRNSAPGSEPRRQLKAALDKESKKEREAFLEAEMALAVYIREETTINMGMPVMSERAVIARRWIRHMSQVVPAENTEGGATLKQEVCGRLFSGKYLNYPGAINVHTYRKMLDAAIEEEKARMIIHANENESAVIGAKRFFMQKGRVENGTKVANFVDDVGQIPEVLSSSVTPLMMLEAGSMKLTEHKFINAATIQGVQTRSSSRRRHDDRVYEGVVLHPPSGMHQFGGFHRS